MNQHHEERILDLIDELNDHPEDDFLSGRMMRAWAEKCLEYEAEERDAVVAFLKHAKCPQVIVELVEQGAHRKRSTQVMKALKDARSSIEADRRRYVEQLCRTFVNG